MKRICIVVLFLFGWALSAQDVLLTKKFFEDADSFFKQYVFKDQIDYAYIKQNTASLVDLLKVVDNADLSASSDAEKKAFYLNGYNLIVIKAIVLNYPVQSTQQIDKFFDTKHKIAGEYMTLNELEHDFIRPLCDDPRIHFALVCGAKGCPPIKSDVLDPARLDAQLDQLTKSSFDDPNFIRVDNEKRRASLSKIFEWYKEDFNATNKDLKPLIHYINHYRTEKIPVDFKIDFYEYDWALNDKTGGITSSTGAIPSTGTNSFRYIIAALYDRGEFEVNLFNNLYSERSSTSDGVFSQRYTFFTTNLQFWYGISNRLNVGFDAKFRSVHQDRVEDSSPLEALKFRQSDIERDNNLGQPTGYSRIGLSAFGPRIKYQPFRNFGNISFQHTLYIPTGKNLSGNHDKGFIDWQGLTFWTQLFYDQQLGDKFGLFAEVDLNIENISSALISGDGEFIQISTPVTIIPSYYATPKITFYGLISAAPKWNLNFPPSDTNRSATVTHDPFNQLGLGAKYLFGNNLQLELLFTEFFKSGSTVEARTYNLGLRYFFRK